MSDDLAVFWRDYLITTLHDRDHAELMMLGHHGSNEFRIIAIAAMHIDHVLARTINNLGGMSAVW